MDPTREPSSVESSYKAAHAVLNTHELLQDILVRLPVKDLVVATGVCRIWHKLKDNVEIQKALFLVPKDVVDINANTDLCLSMRLEDIPRDEYSIVGETHDALAAFSSEHSEWTDNIHLYVTSLRRDFRSTPMFKHELGCRRDMFTSQPPTTSASIVLYADHDPRYRTRSEKEVFHCDTGVKMGALREFCRVMLRSNRWAYICEPKIEGFICLKQSPDFYGRGRWDVREGKIHRQTQLRRDAPEEESPNDDDLWDEETYQRYEYFLGAYSDDEY
jgi:hypothetical protein